VVQGIASIAECDGVSFTDNQLAQTLTPWWLERQKPNSQEKI
jgi:hypothetical protein